MQILSEKITATLDTLSRLAPNFSPKVGIVLGSGLGGFVDQVKNPIHIGYDQLPSFPNAGVAGHKGRLVLGYIGDVPIAVMQGRAHFYETGDASAMKGAIFTLKQFGCENLILTNAAGSIDEHAGSGSVMLLRDHINFTGVSPLFNEQGDQRFVDLVDAYDPEFCDSLLAHAKTQNIELHQGVYMWFCGPHFETPAEIRAAKIMGANAVGMSTVPEVILARHQGMRVAALSIITNEAAGISKVKLSHEHTMKNAGIAAKKIENLLSAFIASDLA
ncbi:MAG: purine-nucleoside phosphorylase [Alphaproteobacteria bacterium]